MTSEQESGLGAWAAFSKEDIDKRHKRAREMMAARGLDALLVTNEENFQYFTGATGSLALHYSNTRPAVLVFPLVGDPIAIVGAMIADTVRISTYVSDARGYTDVLSFPVHMVSDAISGLAPAAKRIGVELGMEQRMGVPVGDYLALVEGMPEVRFEDAADIFVKLRMIKTPEEVEYMRQAAAITGRARQRLFREVVPGMTERDVVRRLRALILEEGGDRTSFVHLISDFPVSQTQFHFDRPLKRGSLLYIDTGAYVRNYTIDYARFATLGPASSEQIRGHSVLLEANRRMTEALKPGLTCAELHEIGAEVIVESGFEVAPVGRMGHGQGIQLTEPPSVSPDDNTVLEEGMIISTEPEVGLNLLWEDVHVITADGSEQLTLEPVDLVEIPFD